MTRYLFLMLVLVACSAPENIKKDNNAQKKKDSLTVVDSIAKAEAAKIPEINDSLDAIARLIAGSYTEDLIYKNVTASKEYMEFSESFSSRWTDFDSSRITKLKEFQVKELEKEVTKQKTVFYPFSGPDILYADVFFPDAERFVLIGLEPVGTLPNFKTETGDSLKRYYDKLNTSLHAILKFSFFRTESMYKDLKNKEVDGTLHLLFLFLSRTGNGIVSAKPITIDSLGKKVVFASFEELKAAKLKSKGAEIIYRTGDDKVKTLEYYSLNVTDAAIEMNNGFKTYLESIKDFNTYLKGASYLLHKPYFSVVRNIILNGSSTIVQDDSGISLHYLKQSGTGWNYKLYGEYTRPISLFRNAYQKDLDSLYKKDGSTPLGFGIGYNFKDKNSNLLIARKK